jgi:hypothetical protein
MKTLLHYTHLLIMDTNIAVITVPLDEWTELKEAK